MKTTTAIFTYNEKTMGNLSKFFPISGAGKNSTIAIDFSHTNPFTFEQFIDLRKKYLYEACAETKKTFFDIAKSILVDGVKFRFPLAGGFEYVKISVPSWFLGDHNKIMATRSTEYLIDGKEELDKNDYGEYTFHIVGNCPNSKEGMEQIIV